MLANSHTTAYVYRSYHLEVYVVLARGSRAILRSRYLLQTNFCRDDPRNSQPEAGSPNLC